MAASTRPRVGPLARGGGRPLPRILPDVLAAQAGIALALLGLLLVLRWIDAYPEEPLLDPTATVTVKPLWRHTMRLQTPDVLPARGGFDLPRAFRVLRASRGISQTEAARKAGISDATWSKAERGRSDLPLRTLGQIAAGHGLTLTQFLGLGMGLVITQKPDGTISSISALPSD